MNKPLYVKQTRSRGRGVFCTTAIEKDELIECCPLLVLPGKDYHIATSSRLTNYFFCFDREENSLALAWGFGSLYNHAVNANATYLLDSGYRTMSYFAIEDIPANTEIVINYSGKSGQEYKEWFDSRNIPCSP